MAVVLGHKLAHLVARHHTEGASVASLGSIVFMLPILQLHVLVNIVGEVMVLISPPLAAWFTWLAWRRKTEKEAGYIGLIMMADAGFDPSAALSFWTKISKTENEAIMRGRYGPEYQSSHPKASVCYCAGT